MTCPECEGKTKVIDTRHEPKTNRIYRKRRCLCCGHDFYTIETSQEMTWAFKKSWAPLNRNGKEKTYD